MLEKKRSKGSVRFGTNNNAGMVMSHKQVQQLLQKGTVAQLPNTAATLSDMKSLCLALLEAVGDKTLALAHQRRANKVLADRMAELERRATLLLPGGGEEGAALFPSRLLLEGYSGSEVDGASSPPLGGGEDSDPGEDISVSEPADTNRLPETANAALDEGCEANVDLPPRLRQMVEKALEDIKLEAKSSFTDLQSNAN